MMKFGFSLQESYCIPTYRVIDILAATGFCAISPGWQQPQILVELIRHAQKRHMVVQSLHGPLRGMPAMWNADADTAQPLLQQLLDSASFCASWGIPILVVHPWNGVDYRFCADDLCFAHFDKLVDHAQTLGITVAFENLEGPEYLQALMSRYKDCSQVGYCWDTGHEACYSPGWDFLSAYGQRLCMTHLNDNLGVTDPSGRLQGTDDLHLLPGDGILDHSRLLAALRHAKSQQILNLELKIRPKGDRCKLDLYSQTPLEEYLSLAYKRACQFYGTYFL